MALKGLIAKIFINSAEAGDARDLGSYKKIQIQLL